jgi:DNA-binding transcriptional ArsR family regulator
MTLLRLNSVALSRSRFAISPLAETLSCLITLHRQHPEPWTARWLARHQASYRNWLARDEVASGLLPLLAATKWIPDFVAVPPLDGVRTCLPDELALVAAHTDDQIAAMTADAVAASWQPPCDTRWLKLGDLGSRIAAMMEEGWARFVAPDWPQRRTVLERDIMHHAGVIAAYGWQHAVKDMTRMSAWVGEDAILFSHQNYPDRWIEEDGLIFVPHTPGGGSWTCERPPHYALVHPARGAAGDHDSLGTDAVSRLLGSGRAGILCELSRPATSTQLAQVLDISLGTVSAHLGVLRDTGMVAGSRAGRKVVYHLTDRGESLLTLLGAHAR